LAAAALARDRSASFSADCANCVGLCCVALAFARSRDFAFSKDAGDACRNLSDDYRCEIHPTLRRDGFKGCTVFDCHGAGQKVTQVVFAGRSWREDDATRSAMFAVFPIVRELQEMLWCLNTVGMFAETAALAVELDATYRSLDGLSRSNAVQILGLDLDMVREKVNDLLRRASDAIRSAARDDRTSSLPARFHPGADLVGAHLAGMDLRGADLSGADLSGADLSTAAFVTQMHLGAATGDAATSLPVALQRPSHWR
jgi:hypothetical protein